MTLPEEFVMDRIIESGKVAQELGAKIVGLGAFTSIVGDAGITVAKNLDIAVTSGNSYTVATAIQGTKEAALILVTTIWGLLSRYRRSAPDELLVVFGKAGKVTNDEGKTIVTPSKIIQGGVAFCANSISQSMSLNQGWSLIFSIPFDPNRNSSFLWSNPLTKSTDSRLQSAGCSPGFICTKVVDSFSLYSFLCIPA